MGEATPTPWWIAGKKTIRYGVKNPRTLQEGGWIADCTWNNGEANARLIVTAVNAHDDLVKYLSIFLGHDDRFQISVGGNPNALDAMLDEARAALAKAQGQ